MRSSMILVLAAVFLFAAGMAAGWFLAPPTARSTAPPKDRDEVMQLRRENADLAARIGELERRAAEDAAARASARIPTEPTASGEQDVEEDPSAPVAGNPDTVPATEEEVLAAARAYGAELQKIIMGDGEEAKAKLHAVLERGGPKGLRALLDRFASSADVGEKMMLAHVLAEAGDPESRRMLLETLRDPDAGLMDRRVISHGLAFSSDPQLEAELVRLARDHSDIAVQANTAFGLARKGHPEGIPLYVAAMDKAFEEKEPDAIMYLSGLQLLQGKALPQVRERVLTYESPQARIILIELLRSQKDEASVPVLRRLVADATTPKEVREAAESALRDLE